MAETESCTRVLVVDITSDGSGYGLIERLIPGRILRSGVHASAGEAVPDPRDHGFSHVIYSGSVHSITREMDFSRGLFAVVERCADAGIPQMGICYGHQLLNRVLVGKDAVGINSRGADIGWKGVEFTTRGQELLGVRHNEIQWQFHFDEVTRIPDNSVLLASSVHTPIEGFLNDDLRILGTQFHPEYDEASGNEEFLNAAGKLKEYGIDAAEIARGRPSFDSGRTMVSFFLNHFPAESA